MSVKPDHGKTKVGGGKRAAATEYCLGIRTYTHGEGTAKVIENDPWAGISCMIEAHSALVPEAMWNRLKVEKEEDGREAL